VNSLGRTRSYRSESRRMIRQTRMEASRASLISWRRSEVLEQFAFFDLLCKFRRCADRSQLISRPDRDSLRLHRKRASAVGQQLPLQALCEFAGLWCAIVIHETAPSGVLSNAKVVLRASEEFAPVETRLRRTSLVMRWTTHHRNQLQKLKEARIARSGFRIHDVFR